MESIQWDYKSLLNMPKKYRKKEEPSQVNASSTKIEDWEDNEED